MEEKIDFTSIILMLGETNERLNNIADKLTKIDRKLSIINTNTKKDTRSVLGANLPPKMVFTVKRTVADKYK